MSKQHIIPSLFALVVLTLLAACGPAAAGPTASPVPTTAPTETAAPTPTPTDVPAPPATVTPSDGSVPFQEGFEGALDGWRKGSDVPEDPDRPGEPVRWSIEISADQAAEGGSSARFTLDGKQDDGTIWLARPFAVEPNQTKRVQLALDLWSRSESFNTLAKVALYAGPEPPNEEADFDTSRAANQVTGWRTYQADLEVDSGAEGRIWVAFGISAVWETEMTYYVDDVRVDIGAVEQGQPPQGGITVEGVHVTDEQVVVRGTSSLAEGTCVSAELWAGGVLQTWWPAEACAPVEEGTWELVVPLEPGHALEPGVQYMVRAYQPGGPNVVSTFPFDLGGPPTPPSHEPGEDPILLLPESAEPLHRASADLDGDGTLEEIVLAGWGGSPGGLGYDFLQLFVIARAEGGGYRVVWQSEQLPTERGEALQVRDLNSDGLPEVLSVQAMGASGETLYVLGRLGAGYGWLAPQGGQFDGGDAFGEVGVRVEDRDGDGMVEILASYGPAAKYTDVYVWDGEAYVYQETLGSLETDFHRAEVAEAELSLEVPSSWTEVDAATWAAPQNPALRLGVRWAELKPPQEPEAAVLPKSAQTLESVPVQLPWASARRFVVEVYGEAQEGGGQAPVTSVEAHVLAVIETDGGRRAIDVYTAAPDAQVLTTLEPVLHRAITSVALQTP